MAGVCWVYVLRCADDSLYTGWTVDLDRRLAAHQAGSASRYTRSRRPVSLAAAWEVDDRSAALREEARIKALPRAAKLALVARAGTPPGPSATAAVRRSR
ncbi:MAG: GIY-YIG nuclease family protein [Solirubrobacteraceae bacterium]|nr:GIY-YIG nuclease family protein [Solirubrobacteraceae bacterium]